MRPLPSLRFCVSTVALAVLLGGGAALAPGCSIFDSATQCQSACNALVQCGVIQESDCGGYCATAVSNATYTGCTDQLDAQNTCAQANGQCDGPSPQTCATEVAAFTMCVTDHCTSDPNSDGCPIVSGDGGTGGSAPADGG
jgi:hypothetical protein